MSLSPWLIIWVLTVLIQAHTTPGNSLVLAYGKTKVLVLTSGIACIISIVINVLLSSKIGVGSAIVGYAVYVGIVIGSYYLFFYKRLLNLSRKLMFKNFAIPTVIAILISLLVSYIPIELDMEILGMRLALIIICIVKSMLWLVSYAIILCIFGIIKKKEFSSLIEGILGKS